MLLASGEASNLEQPINASMQPTSWSIYIIETEVLRDNQLQDFFGLDLQQGNDLNLKPRKSTTKRDSLSEQW
jgi:hypothetical protein